MLVENITDDMRVEIFKIDRTKEHYGHNSTMEDMVTKIYKVDSIEHYGGSVNAIRIRGYDWHPDDLKLPEKIKLPKAEIFDPNELVI